LIFKDFLEVDFFFSDWLLISNCMSWKAVKLMKDISNAFPFLPITHRDFSLKNNEERKVLSHSKPAG